MRAVLREGMSVLVEASMERTEWFVLDHPGCSGLDISGTRVDRAVSSARSLYKQSVVRPRRDAQ